MSIDDIIFRGLWQDWAELRLQAIKHNSILDDI
jgi:hypothetical protein